MSRSLIVGLIALAAMIIASVTALLINNTTVPEELWSTLTLIIGGLVGAITGPKLAASSPPVTPPK